MTDMIQTGWALYKSGYIKEDGTDVFSEQVAEAKTKEELIKLAKKRGYDPDEYYMLSVGYEIIDGLRVPDTGEEYDYLYNYIPRK